MLDCEHSPGHSARQVLGRELCTWVTTRQRQVGPGSAHHPVPGFTQSGDLAIQRIGAPAESFQSSHAFLYPHLFQHQGLFHDQVVDLHRITLDVIEFFSATMVAQAVFPLAIDNRTKEAILHEHSLA